jgi:hypothetical protein
MWTQKQIKKYERTKYTRELERYLNRIVKFVSTKEFSHDEFEGYVDEIFKPFEDIKKVILESEYYKKLEEFVEYSANLPSLELDSEEVKKIIQHRANQLQKIKRVRNFTKSKHKGKRFEH